MSNHKLLFLAYYAPPVQVTGNIRRHHLLEEFKKHFNQVFLITSANAKRMRKDPSLAVSNIPIHQVSTFDLRRLLLQKKRPQSPTLPATFKNNSTFKISRKWADSFPLNLLLDDGGVTYIWSAYREASRLIQQYDIHYLFSSFRPIVDHVIAHLLKRRFPKLKWIADYRDLPVDPIRRNTIFPKIQNRWQKYLIKSATLISTVSQGLAKTLKGYHKTICVLSNGIADISFSHNSESHSKFSLAYTGSLYPELQDPRPLFQAILDLKKQGMLTKDNFQLIYAGKDAPVWTAWLSDYGLQDFGIEKGLVSYKEALHLQNRSQLNLILSWSSLHSGGILMTKLGSYLTARQPILVLLNGCKDEEMEDNIARIENSQVTYSSDKLAVASVRDYIKDQLAQFENFGPRILPEPSSANPGTIGRWEDEVLKLLKHPKLEFYVNSSELGTIPRPPNNV